MSGNSALRLSTSFSLLVSLAALALAVTPSAHAESCESPELGSGTAELPLSPCEYISPFDAFELVDGLPPGTTIVFQPVLHDFQCSFGSLAFCSTAIVPGTCEVAGGGLGGTLACSKAEIYFEVHGTGLLAGFTRTITMPVDVETHHGPRTPFDPQQELATDVFRLEGAIFGDPDFDQLELRAGTAFGLPSPGQMRLAEERDSDWRARESLDLAYSFSFVGAPGGVLDGMAGTTTSTVPLEVGTNVCPAPDNGAGTATLPPATCDYVNDDPMAPYELLDGLPPGTTILLEPIHREFLCTGSGSLPTCSVVLPSGVCEAAGGTLGGDASCHESTVYLDVRGTGSLAGFSRTLVMSLTGEFHTGPRIPGNPLQQVPQAIHRWEGEIFGDPDFCTFRFRAGDFYGLPSPGVGRLTEEATGDFRVDSVFEVTYEIEFKGCAGSALEGFEGTTTGAIPISIGNSPGGGAVPGLVGGWLWLAAALLGISSVWVIRERAAQR